MPQFLIKGKKARAAWKQENKDHQRRQEEFENRVYRYYLPTGKDGRVTFLDGDLDPDGVITMNMVKEHNLHIGGHWRNWFLCTDHGEEGAEPCPICEGGDKPYHAALFTVIDHSKWTDKNGKEHQFEVKLFVAKREARGILQKLATKRNGLAGCTFDVSRSGEGSPNVGNVFEFVSKHPVGKFAEALKKKGIDAKVVDYEKALPYYTADELRKKGFGSSTPIGAEDDDDPVGLGQDQADVGDLEGLL